MHVIRIFRGSWFTCGPEDHNYALRKYTHRFGARLQRNLAGSNVKWPIDQYRKPDLDRSTYCSKIPTTHNLSVMAPSRQRTIVGSNCSIRLLYGLSMTERVMGRRQDGLPVIT